MPNMGKYKNHLAESKTVTLTTAEQNQSELVLPVFGDIAGFLVDISVSVTGTLSTAKTIEKAIKNLVVKDKSGNTLLQNIRGEDLIFIERYRTKGRTRTIPTASASAGVESFFIPLNIEKANQEAKVQISIAPYSDMATSGATGGSITYSIYALYYESTEKVGTEQIRRISKTVAVGSNSFGIDLPKGLWINNILFKVTTEANYTDIRFSGDGNKELDNVKLRYLVGHDNALLISGHVTGEFSLYNAPFYSTPAVIFDVNAGTADAMQIFTISEYAPAK